MNVVCAWCGEPMSDDGVADGKVSHGICKDCLDKELKRIEEKGGE